MIKVIDKKTNTPSSCIKINNSTVSQVDCNPLENKQIWEIDFLGQSKEICLIKSTDTEKYLLSMVADKYEISGNLPERNINNVNLKPFLWRVLENT